MLTKKWCEAILTKKGKHIIILTYFALVTLNNSESGAVTKDLEMSLDGIYVEVSQPMMRSILMKRLCLSRSGIMRVDYSRGECQWRRDPQMREIRNNLMGRWL